MLNWQKLFFAKSTRLLTPANRYVYILQVADLQKSLRQVRDSLSRTLNTEIQDTLHRLGGEGVMENIVQFQRGKHMASIEVPLGKNPSLNLYVDHRFHSLIFLCTCTCYLLLFSKIL